MRLLTALRLGRVSNLPTVWTNVLAGAALGGLGSEWAPLSALCLAMSLLYVGGMYLNDAFDAEVDARERPERPIPRGEISRASVYGIGGALLTVGVLIAACFGLRPFVAALLTAMVIVLYDWLHKRTALAPAIMGSCRLGVYASAASLSPEPRLGPVVVGALLLFVYVMGLTYAAARENSSALVRVGPLFGLFAPLAARAISGPYDLLGGVLSLVFGACAVVGFRLVRTRVPAQIRRGIGLLIAGIALVDALALSSVPHGAVLVPFALAAFVLTLLFQRFVPGT
jgi:hypothetical protein